MKLTLLFAALIASTFCSAQMQRAFYNFENASFGRTEILAEINNQLVFASIKDQSEDTIILVTGYIDEYGETSNYRTKIIPDILTGTTFAISGYAVNANNELVLAIQAYIDGVTGSTMNYIQVNPLDHLVIPIYLNPTQMKGAFVRSRQNGDSLVSYFANSANEFTRMATSLNNIMAYSSSTIAQSFNYSGGLNLKRVEFLVAENGNEYVSVGTTIFKHTPLNVVTTKELIGFSNFNGVSLCQNTDSNNELLIVHGNAYRQLTSNLDSLTSGTITGLSSGMSRNTELFFENGKYFYLATTGSNRYSPIIINAATYTIDSSMENLSMYYVPNDLLITSNGHYFIGIKSAADSYSTFVSKLEVGISPEPFIEYGQFLYSANQKVNTSHLGKFFNNENATAGFLTQHEGDYKGLIFSASNSIVGIDGSSDTVGFANTYYAPTMYPGPFLPEVNRTTDIIDKYNRGYAVDKAMIDNHILNISSGNPNYEIPFGIRDWPGNGNGAIGQATSLLPFNDHNNNGIYEPHLGDYPQIYGDQCVVNVFHQGEEANDIGLECHQYIYSFDCDSSELMRNTIFINQRFFARTSDLNNAYVGNFMDIDIGGPADDYVGSNVALGMIYGYNGDYFDLTDGGITGFNSAIPAVGMQVLRGPKLADDLQDNNIGIGVNESVNGFGFADALVDNEYLTLESFRATNNGSVFPYTDPFTLAEGYNVYQGRLSNGSDVLLGGSPITFEYFGNSDPWFYASNGVDHGNNYTESTAGNFAGDRRVYAGSGPVHLTSANVDTFELISAYLVAHDTISASPVNFGLDILFQRASQLKTQFAQNIAGCGSTFGLYESPHHVGVEELEMTASIYPNPTQSIIKVMTDKTEMQSIQLYSMDGLMVVDQKVDGNTSLIDLSALRSGIYLVKINTTNGTVTKKVSKL